MNEVRAYRFDEAAAPERRTPAENLRLLERLRQQSFLAVTRPDLRPNVGGPTLNDDFLRFLRLLEQHRVRYLLVGGLAVAVHGYVRYTQDMDVWIARDPENANRMVEVLLAFNLEPMDAAQFLRVDVFYRLGDRGTVLDVFTGIGPGFQFAEHLERALWVEVDGLRVPVVGLEDLLRIKKRAGRPQDLADVAALQALRDSA